MRRLAQFLSVAALVGTVLPAALLYADTIDLPQLKRWMLAAGVLWFGSAPVWLERRATSKAVAPSTEPRA
jgi:hypothetical protein